jgi:multidrug resistance efflux pump
MNSPSTAARSSCELKRAPTAAARPTPSSGKARRLVRPRRTIAALVTLAVVGLAALGGAAAWNTYMEGAWTRDATLRAHVVTMAPQLSGPITELPVSDNRFVHKGDLLMVIDPTDYNIGVSLAEATVQQAQAIARNAEAQSHRRQALNDLAATTEEKEIYAAKVFRRKPVIGMPPPIWIRPMSIRIARASSRQSTVM